MELCQSFQAEVHARETKSKVFVTDLRPDFSAACRSVGDYFPSPPVTDPGYKQFLMDVCLTLDIGLVVPTIDTELLVLASCKEEFAANDIHVVVSDVALVNECRDKRKTVGLFSRINLRSPEVFSRDELEYPCFVKPYDGSSSVGARVVDCASDLTPAIRDDPRMMFMELVPSCYKEYTVDLYFDREGQLRCLIPRERIEVRAGEVSKGVTRRDFVYKSIIKQASELKGARGCVTMQLFANHATQDVLAFEINPRFGGGFPLSYAAGGEYPGWLIDEYLLGKSIPFCDSWEADLLMLRYDSKIVVHNVK